MGEINIKFNQNNKIEQEIFNPEVLSFDELLFLAKRLQERLEIYRDWEFGVESAKENREALLLTVNKVETILDKMTNKEDLLKSLEIFYELYESWAFLLENKRVSSYAEYLAADYNEYKKVALLQEETPEKTEKLERPEGKKEYSSRLAEILLSEEKYPVEESVEPAMEKPPVKIEDWAENPDASLQENINIPLTAEKISFVDEQGTELAAEINRLDNSIIDLEQRLLNLDKGTDKKVKDRLENKLQKNRNRLELLKKEHLEKSLAEFFNERKINLESYLLNLAEQRDRRAIYRLYSLAEKMVDRALVPEDLKAKLKKQGTWGKILADAGNLKDVSEYYLLGTSLGLGPSTLVAGAELPKNDILNLLDLSNKRYPFLKVASADWAKAHAWEGVLKEETLDDFSLAEIAQYASHHESSKMLSGESVENDNYYQTIFRILKQKLNQAKRVEAQKYDKLNVYFNDSNENLNEALSANLVDKKQADHLAYFVSSGSFRNALDNLFFSEESIKAGTITEQFVAEGVNLSADDGSLLADSDILKEKTLSESKEAFLLAAATESLDKGILNNNEDDFVRQHPLLSANRAVVDFKKNNKKEIRFDLDRFGRGHFKSMREALRVLAMDVFPMEKLLDDDKFSGSDAARVERAIDILNGFLSGEEIMDFDTSDWKSIIQKKKNSLIVKDYEALSAIFGALFDFSKKLNKEEKMLYLNVAKDIAKYDNNDWEKILPIKLSQ